MTNKIVVIGESVLDIVSTAIPGSDDRELSEHPGGSPSNVAVGLARLGHTPLLVTELGDDRYGEVMRQHFAENKVEVDVLNAEHTPSAVAYLDERGSAEYTFNIGWEFSAADPQVFASADHLHTGSIAAFAEPGAGRVIDTVTEARSHATVSYDPNIRSGLIDDMDAVRGRVLSMVEQSDVIKCSDEDLSTLFPAATSFAEQKDILHGWLSRGPQLVVLTRGGEGALLMNHHAEATVPTGDVEVVDTVGAGDSFMGALIDALAHENLLGATQRANIGALPAEKLAQIGAFASRVADITVSRSGANPPYRHEL